MYRTRLHRVWLAFIVLCGVLVHVRSGTNSATHHTEFEVPMKKAKFEKKETKKVEKLFFIPKL